MDDHVIDCCSLINLYTGWKGLEELAAWKRTWHVCEAVLRESEYTREYTGQGLTTIPLDLGRTVQKGLLRSARPETAEEIEDYVNFAIEVDDGEAQAIAVAKNRGYALLTDDYKAGKLASSADVGVTVITTPLLLQEWGNIHEDNKTRLREVVRRITELARFTPRVDFPHFDWWRDHLGE